MIFLLLTITVSKLVVSLMEFSPLGAIPLLGFPPLVVSPSADEISPTQKTASKRFADRISPIRNYVAGISPTQSRSFRCWDFSHLEDCVCTLCCWDFHHSETSTQTCLLALFRLAYGNRMRFSLLEVSSLLQGFPPLRAPCLILC